MFVHKAVMSIPYPTTLAASRKKQNAKMWVSGGRGEGERGATAATVTGLGGWRFREGAGDLLACLHVVSYLRLPWRWQPLLDRYDAQGKERSGGVPADRDGLSRLSSHCPLKCRVVGGTGGRF